MTVVMKVSEAKRKDFTPHRFQQKVILTVETALTVEDTY